MTRGEQDVEDTDESTSTIKGVAPVDKDYLRIQFARRLQHELDIRGMTGSELSRKASALMPDGKSVGRDSISNYLRGINLPGSVPLNAIAKALGVSPEHLLPRPVVKQERQMPEFAIKEVSEGKSFLQINKIVETAKALKIAAILAGAA